MPSDDSKRRPEARKAASTGAVPSFLSIFAHAADRFEDPAPVVEGEPVGDGDLTIERGPNLDEAEQALQEASRAAALTGVENTDEAYELIATIRRSLSDCEVKSSTAMRMRLLKLYPDLPSNRSLWTTSIVVHRKPIHIRYIVNPRCDSLMVQ